MKIATSFLAGLVLMGSVGVSGAKAADGVLMKQEFAPGSYCHQKFAAIRPSTLDTDNPTADTGIAIDFYGSCDESPTGADQVHEQKLDEQHRFEQDYED